MLIKRISWLPALAGWALLLSGCPTDNDKGSFDYLRSPIAFRIDTVPAAHPYCSGDNTPFATAAECQAAKKYRLTWERPEDTVGFLEYRIFIDTTPPNAVGQNWTQLRRNRALAHGNLAGVGGFSDSVIFTLGSATFQTAALTRGDSQIVAFDTTGRIDSLGRLIFAVTTAYRESGLDGQPRYTWIITNDRFPPYPLITRFVPLDRKIEISWSRPRDRTSFFDPGADSGRIREYYLRVTRSGVTSGTRNSIFNPQIVFLNGGTDRTGEVDTLDFTANGLGNGHAGAPGRRFRLPDSSRIFERVRLDPRDSLRVILSNLDPRDTVDVTVWAVDSSGNFTGSDTSKLTTLILTDTTQPLKPVLRSLPGSATRNRLAYAFTASRDRVEGPAGGLIPADSANANILEYRITRLLLRGSYGGNARWDTVIRPEGPRLRDTLFVDTLKYLPPGAVFRIFAQAVDSSGFLSARDSLDDSTLTVRFTGVDSAATCPPGLVPIPAGRFMLGDTSSAADPDEKPPGFSPATRRFLGAFCIEPYEHRDTLGNFRSRVTWQQADAACRDIFPSDSSHLCTEAEWERSCETDESVPLLYGMQSERAFPTQVAATCNIGTGDSTMAFASTLRDPACLTQEGVFDLSGNLAEWVGDPYDSLAYTRARDTLPPGGSTDSTTYRSLHGFRGGYYLKARQSPAAALRSARCSNRDYPVHVRPWPHVGCVDPNYPQIVVLYAAAKPPRCLPLPDSLRSRKISAISPSLDSTKLLLLVEGEAQPVIYALPSNDTTYRNLRPVDAKISTRTLAAVSFINTFTGESIPDTLDAVEMRDTSDAALGAIFSREASPPWAVQRVGGRYGITYLYAYLHASTRGVPAKPHYSNAILGFRCCTRIRP